MMMVMVMVMVMVKEYNGPIVQSVNWESLDSETSISPMTITTGMIMAYEVDIMISVKEYILAGH